MFDLLSTRRKRLALFFLLYVTGGIPLGFTSVALAAQLRRAGVGPAAIGAFVAAMYLPWSWKWVMGPVVDMVWSQRLGRRRAWIVGAQIMMAITLLAMIPLDPSSQIRAFTVIVLMHNTFAALQDVAIDALACTTLQPEERGTANGLMFAGSYIGSGIGGAGVLLLLDRIGLPFACLLVFGLITILILFVSIHIQDRPEAAAFHGSAANVSAAVRRYAIDTAEAFFGSVGQLFGVLFALLPTGAYAMGLAIQTNLAVELGLDDTRIGLLSVASTIMAASGCVLGGKLSDTLGRVRFITISVLLTILPTLAFAIQLSKSAWLVSGSGEILSPAPHEIITGFWIACTCYNFAQGLIQGSRTAMFMDLVNPTVAATQFTAYMAMMNLAIALSAWWQGIVAESHGYSTVLFLDCAVGGICLLTLPFLGAAIASRKNVQILLRPVVPSSR